MSTSITSLTLFAFVALALQVGRSAAEESTSASAESRARAFIAEHESQVRPLEIAVALAWWNANTSGKDEDFAAKEAAQNKLDQALSDATRFAELKALRESKLADPLPY